MRVAIVFFLLVKLSILTAQEKELSVLFVGNSYTYSNNLPHIVSILSDSTQAKLITRKSIVGGAHLWEHWNGDRGLQTRQIIREGDFDIVVLQDNSMSAIDTPDSTIKYVKLFARYSREYGAKTYLFNTWAREKVPQYQEIIDEVYTRAATENNAVRVRVGSAWQLAMDLRPSAELFSPDGSHPTPLGTLLAASMFVRAISGELPKEYPKGFKIIDQYGETAILMHIDELNADFCRRIVEEIYSEDQTALTNIGLDFQ